MKIPVQIKWLNNEDVEITITESGEQLEFIEGHCVYLIYAKLRGEILIVETEKPWLMDGVGLLWQP